MPLTGPLPLPVGEEAAVPHRGGAGAAVHGSLDHKHLCLSRAHCLPLNAQGRLGAVQPGVSLFSQSPLPPGAIPMCPPHAVNHILPTSTSHIPLWYPQPDPDSRIP